MQADLFIAPDGTITFVYADELMLALGDLGPARSPRASWVESTEDGKHWTADMSPTCREPIVLGPFTTRAEALAAEHAWLIDYLRQE